MKTVHLLGHNIEFVEILVRQGHRVLVWDDIGKDNIWFANGSEYAGTWDEFIALAPDMLPVPNMVVGVCSSAEAREKALHRLEGVRCHAINVISERANISIWAVLGNGIYIGDGAFVGPRAIIADWSCVLPCGQVHHNSVVNIGSIVVGNACVLGGASTGRNTWVCGGATVLPYAVLDNNSVVPARGIVRRTPRAV